MMLDSCTYDKIKLVHQLSCLVWFIDKHGKKDALEADDQEFYATLCSMQKELDKYISILHAECCD